MINRMFEEIRITDNHDRTVDIIELGDGRYQIAMYEASSDYIQDAWFATKEEAINFANNWVHKQSGLGSN